MKRKTLRERTREYADKAVPDSFVRTAEWVLVHGAFTAGAVSERAYQRDARKLRQERDARKGKGEK
jgi:hypothetical protein